MYDPWTARAEVTAGPFGAVAVPDRPAAPPGDARLARSDDGERGESEGRNAPDPAREAPSSPPKAPNDARARAVLAMQMLRERADRDSTSGASQHADETPERTVAPVALVPKGDGDTPPAKVARLPRTEPIPASKDEPTPGKAVPAITRRADRAVELPQRSRPVPQPAPEGDRRSERVASPDVEAEADTPAKVTATTSSSVEAKPGETLRLNMPERTGCTLRSAIAYWPSSLPDWLSVNGASGIVSGVVPTETTGAFALSITAANGLGATATMSVVLDIRAEAEIEPGEATETIEAFESAMRTTLDALPALRALVAAGGGRSGRIRMRG